ncbi:Uncharacterised protein [Segatella copri]|nr:Uncharacterised protein [Segatella copri]
MTPSLVFSFISFIGSPQQLSTAPGFTTSTTLPQIWQR